MSAREIRGEVVEFSPEAAEAIRRRGPLPPVPEDCYPPDAVPLPVSPDPRADSEYVVSEPMWPAGRSDDLTVGEVFAVLDKVDEAYPVAVAGLARTEVEDQP